MERMVVVCRKEGRKEEGTQEHKKREIQTGKGDIFWVMKSLYIQQEQTVVSAS